MNIVMKQTITSVRPAAMSSNHENVNSCASAAVTSAAVQTYSNLLRSLHDTIVSVGEPVSRVYIAQSGRLTHFERFLRTVQHQAGTN